MWEYRVVACFEEEARAVLSTLGAEGWELVAVIKPHAAYNRELYLKREKSVERIISGAE